MPAVSANAPSSTTTTSSKTDGADYEPDDEWKLQLRKRIEEGLQSMVADAKENQAAELRKSPDTPETRLRLEASYKQAMQTIKGLATEQYQLELDRERNQRRWTAGVPMNPGWTQYFIEEQQNIMNSIKQSSNQSDNSARTGTVSESPTDERRSVISKPSNEPPAPAPLPVLQPVPPNPSPRPTEERERSSTSPQSVRRGSDARSTLSRDRDEPHGSFRRGYHSSTHERPSLPDNWVAPDTVEEPEDILRPVPPRARLSSTDRPSQPSPVSPAKRDSSISRSSGSINSADRHLARSPPGPPPEVWKPAISPAEDALPPKTFKLGRRGSATSMKSTGSGTSMRSAGSGASIRPSITETIPERADERPDESAIEEIDHGGTIEQGRTWISTDKPREKEKRSHLRRNSRPSPVDLRSDEPFGSSGLRSAGSSTMQYATSPMPNGPLSAKPSLTFVNDDRHYPNDIPGKPPPYHEYRDQTSSPRDSYHLPQDQPSGRPIPASARSSYGGDDRDYFSPYSTPHRPHGPKPFPYHPQRESRSISRQTSFTRQPYVDIDDDDDDDRDMDQGGERDRERPWDRDYDRDRDRDGGRDMYSERRGAAYPHSISRHSPYINPPPGGPRPAPQEYVNMNEVYDDRSEGAGPSRDGYNYRSLPPDDWEYQRPPDSARHAPSRQMRPRDDFDRRYTENDGHARHYPPAGSIPIPRHTPSLEAQPAWSHWAAEGNRYPNYDYPQQARSPPNVEPFLHRPFTQPPPSYHNSPHDSHPTFGGRETDLSLRSNSAVEDEYDSEDDTDSEAEESESSEDEAKKMRNLEAKRQKLEESRREADDELKKTEEEIQRLAAEEARKKKDEEDKRKEEERKEEEARRREEEALRKEEEVRKKEEEVKRKEEEATKKEEEAKRMGEEAKKKEEEAKRKEREAKRKEQDAKKKEEAARRKEEEARRKAEELSRKEEETRQRAAKLEEDTERTKQMQLEAQKIAEDALKKQEDLKKMEEEARKKDMEMKEREDILRRREEELMRREADNFRREVEAKKKEEEAKQKAEEAKQREEARQREAEVKQKEAAAKREELRREEARKREESRKEEIRKREEAKRNEEAKRKAEAKKEEERKEEAKKEEERREEERREEERREEEKKEEERLEAERQEKELIMEENRKRDEAQQKQLREEEAKKKATEADLKRKLEAEEAKRKADETAKENSRREDARLEGFRREQEEKRLQNEHLGDTLLNLDPKMMEVQYKVLHEAGLRKKEEEARKREESSNPIFLQQAEFRKREEDIRRTREERKRNDSVGNDNAWPNSSFLSASPGTSPGMSRTPPQFGGPSIPERSAGPSSWASGPPPARGPSMKSPAPSSPTANRSSASTSAGKPRTGSVSSGTYSMNSSPHTASFSEAERARKQQEFAESQQEQFRRTQEKLEAERQLKSAGRPLSREELQRVFEHHERLWNRLNSLGELSWTDFPWPMAKPPLNPDDMSLPLIGAYIQSPAYPDKDKSRTIKDRIKEHIRRWHPDRFETKLLPKVVEDEREKVKHGAGNVARYLSDLLMKENDSNNNMFGD